MIFVSNKILIIGTSLGSNQTWDHSPLQGAGFVRQNLHVGEGEELLNFNIYY